MSVGVGDRAPDFSLVGIDGTTARPSTYTLADHRGHPVVLVFYPADNSPVCTRQLGDYTSQMHRFSEVGAAVLGLSPQDEASHAAFVAAEGGFGFPLLCDIGKEVAREYGVLGPAGFYKRSVFVVDADGTIRYAHRATAGLGYRPVDEIVAALPGPHGRSDSGADRTAP